MKRLILTILLGLAAASFMVNHAETLPITTNTNNNGNGSNSGRDRAPLRIHLDVYIDTDTNIVTVGCSDDMIAQVTIYNQYNEVVSYSPFLNSEHYMTGEGLYTIVIQGSGWTATGEFTI